jgi:alkyl sulfatase BDS1-like metallo-beta-lactamase superfamily hydrolase
VSAVDDRQDFADADRGLIGSLRPGIVKDAGGKVVWDNDVFAFLDGDCPDTASPSLWRQSQLCARQGLYEVTDGIYQVRGLDLSNMTLVEGDRGVIVIDPLISAETAAAALALYREHRGGRPVTGVIYTHSHIDHFGGVAGVTGGDVPILAPAGFLEHAVSENVYAGTAMLRRGIYHTGESLTRGPRGLVGTGLGQTGSVGTMTLLAPTVDITRTGQEETLDGVRIIFQRTPGTEAPSEMNFWFPDRKALCMAENATHNLHNILTLRGALVRDARIWSRYLQEAITLFAGEAEVAFASHHWPTWGNERIVAFLSEQRDLYAYLHDQTLRLLNQGYTGTEIAEMMELPPELARQWHTRGYYGSVSHNVKAIYQRYLGWFDGNPAHLWEHPPAESARRYVDCMGGADAVLAKAGDYARAGDLRFAVQLLNHAVFADPGNKAARDMLADAYERLGFGAECGTWRNFYLTGAQELRHGVQPGAGAASPAGLASALTVEQLFDSIAIRVNGPKAWSQSLTIDWDFTDLKTAYRMTLSNGALSHWRAEPSDGADLTLTLTRPRLLSLLMAQGADAERAPQAPTRNGPATISGAAATSDPAATSGPATTSGAVTSGAGLAMGGIAVSGDPAILDRLMSLLDDPDPVFPIVTP